MGLFDKLKQGLSKTKEALLGSVDNVLNAFKRVDEELFEELEEALITADVGIQTTMDIIGKLREEVKKKGITEGTQVKTALMEIIAQIMESGEQQRIDISKTPAIIMIIGVNGVGKTTTIGKLASKYKSEGKKVMLAAADTFRAAAIDQLQIWADRAGVEIVKHKEGSDPAAVIFDALNAAKARGFEVLICDTAGRLHNKKNLMEELRKVLKIAERESPNSSREVILVLDATTGQNALSQAKLFGEVAEITGIALTKLDGTAKGGVVIAISHEQRIPVKLVGVGEGMDDLQDFSPQDYVNALFNE